MEVACYGIAPLPRLPLAVKDDSLVHANHLTAPYLNVYSLEICPVPIQCVDVQENDEITSLSSYLD